MTIVESNRNAYRLRQFCDPDTKLGAEDQFAVLNTFWQGLGYDFPGISAEQMAKAKAHLAYRSKHRLIGAPILANAADRVDLTRRGRRIAPPSSRPDYGRLQLPQEGASSDPRQAAYGRILRAGLDEVITVKGAQYAVGYKSAGSEDFVMRSEFVKDLEKRGKVLLNEEGLPWFLSVMDANANLTNYSLLKTPGSRTAIHDAEAGGTVEQAIALELMHGTNDTPRDSEWRINLTNEAVFQIEPDEGFRETLTSVAYVSRLPQTGGLILGSVLADSASDALMARTPHNVL